MKPLFSFLHLLILFGLGALTLILFLLPVLPEKRMEIASLLIEHPEQLSLLAWGMAALSSFFCICFYAFDRKKRIDLSIGLHRTSLEKPLIQEAIKTCFLENFGDAVVLTSLEVGRKNRLFVEVKKREKSLSLLELEKVLVSLLFKRFGLKELVRVSVVE